jgi:hypothetical protein
MYSDAPGMWGVTTRVLQLLHISSSVADGFDMFAMEKRKRYG